MNRAVNISKRVKTGSGTRYCPVVLSANGRVKPDAVLVNGKQETHKEGAYYLEWREGQTRVRLSVGKDAATASARRQRKEAELNAMNNGATIVPESGNTGRSLTASIAAYLEDVKLKQTTNKPKNFGRHNTTGCYSTALSYFAESCHKMNLEEIERHDLLKFAAFLQTHKNQGPRSVHNKFQIVMSFLKAQGIRGLSGQNRLATLHRNGTGDLRAGRTRQTIRCLRCRGTIVV